MRAQRVSDKENKPRMRSVCKLNTVNPIYKISTELQIWLKLSSS